jgi:hypothetical protein
MIGTRFIVLLLLMVTSHFSSGQGDAILNKCRADQKLWISKLDPPDPIYDDDPRLPGWEAEDRQYREMQKCASADPDHRDGYYRVTSEIIADRTIRIGRFLRRHGKLEDFQRENPGLRADSPKVDRATRMTSFLRRHNLFGEFEREDATTHKNGLVVR